MRACLSSHSSSLTPKLCAAKPVASDCQQPGGSHGEKGTLYESGLIRRVDSKGVHELDPSMILVPHVTVPIRVLRVCSWMEMKCCRVTSCWYELYMMQKVRSREENTSTFVYVPKCQLQPAKQG